MNKLVKIYRIEDVQGSGMYKSTSIAHEFMSTENHPSPWADEKLRYDEEGADRFDDASIRYFKFGFCSKAQMNRWVSKRKWLRSLDKVGQVISIYTCNKEDVIMGDTQAIFKNSVSREQHNILKFFKLKQIKNKLDKDQSLV